MEELRNGVCWNHIKQTLGKIHAQENAERFFRFELILTFSFDIFTFVGIALYAL